ncbi:iron-sulfur cluster assembly scaffold protein [Desulfosporosinus fructosivorans]|uniref:Iron-sulfur cluster assembly scaffold protein n=1 Tax=Desulfosporosinus fructosivorans TaxID=2018669 RepID=A0A4Z0R7N3_9FIRM|nr:iron-sulfur cluster assembly scaffold protein [Desulfosporosinus fructosivorans]TGE38850.1 iron-sulfur cluster assembly scaffold protein [Desulfosporosinus fructosivorans]
MYSEKVMEHFKCPQNVGSMEDADGEGTVGDPNCGDSLTIYVKVQAGIITRISFLVFGCTASIATSSMITVLAMGKSLDEAIKISEQDVIDSLDGLPEKKQHCSNLGVSALRKAIYNYLEKRGISNPQIGSEFSSKSYFNVKTVRV